MGMKINRKCIRDVCDGNGRATAKGFFWRWKGSSNLPNHLMGAEKVIHIREKKNGEVVKEFRTSRTAQKFLESLGEMFDWSTVCRWCRNEAHELGFYWKYNMLKKSTIPSETLFSKRKRLRILQADNKWEEGTLTSFDSTTQRFQINYDSGNIEHHKLEGIVYEWKNDHGQKPVEQIDLKSGESLRSFDSVSDAAFSVGGEPTHITAVCSGRSKSSNGFFWRFKGSQAQPPRTKLKKKVQQVCLETGRDLAVFDSITDAGKAVGITTSGISFCCNGRKSSISAGGFGWKFVQEES